MTNPDNVILGAKLDKDRTLSADVVIVGTGAGGGTAAEILSAAGLKVVMLEEGGYYQAADFHMQEAEAYPQLYYEVGARKTKDKSITILQGRAVGGSTTINWTTCFRTPKETLNYWSKAFGVKGFSDAEMAPWFERMEKRLNIEPWPIRNANNDVLYRGAKKLGWAVGAIPRNVKACRDLGYCGMGCPVDAKQSMLVTTIPAALANGATLIAQTRAQALEIKGDRVVAVNGIALKENSVDPTGRKVRVEAPYVVLAGGAINTPGLLLRSQAPDPYDRIGKRTFLHVTNVSTAMMPEKMNPFYGAPQSAYSNQFLFRDGVTGRLGYKMEVPPLHPILTAVSALWFGKEHAEVMARLPHLSAVIALMRDGFHEDSPGGSVSLLSDGSPVLDYPLTDYLWDGIRHAYVSMAEIQFAAGAERVVPVHMDVRPDGYANLSDTKKAIADLSLKVLRTQLFSAHVMGGCGMGTDPKESVVGNEGKFHHLANLWVFDGSLFPTSLGANPSLTIYAIAARLANRLAEAAGGKIKPTT